VALHFRVQKKAENAEC